MPFEDDDSDLETSAYDKKRAPKKTTFDDRAKEIFSTNEKFKSKIAELALKYKEVLEDKTLIKNKGYLSNNKEQEVINNLIQIASDINNDESQPINGFGSISLNTLLLKCMILMRNRMNELEFTVEQLKKL